MTKTSRVPIPFATVDDIPNIFIRAHGWLRLKTSEGCGLWINPITRALASYDAGVLLTTEHETNLAFCDHFADMALLHVHRDGVFPTANVRGDDEMIERLRALGLDPIIDGENDGE